MFEEKKREWKKDSPKTTMLWQSPNGCGIRAAREEWLANLTIPLTLSKFNCFQFP
jgi:hypothetical protein